MKTIRILLLALLASAAFVCPRAQAQIGQITNPVSAPLYAQDAGTCSATANSNLIQQLPPNASTTTVNLSGTFSATVTVRASNNGGATWVTLGTASAAGTTTYGTNSYTHLCADVTTYTSGTVNVTISTGVVGGGNGNSGSVSLPTTLGNSIVIAKDCSLYASSAACFKANMNWFQQNGCSWSSASAAITCPAGTFASSMVGEDFGGYHTCQTNATLYRSDFASGTTISSFTDSAHVTVSNNSTNGETGTSSTGCVMAATPDDAAILAARSYWIASPVCLNIFISDGGLGLKDPHSWFGSSGTGTLGEPVACANSGIFVGEGAGASYTLSGAGPSTTIIWLPPDFVSANCNSQSSYGNACFWNSNGLWRDFQVTTGGIGTFSFGTQHALFASAGQVNGTTSTNQFAFFENFYCVNVAPSDSNLIGFSTGLWWTEHRFVYADGCGGVSLQNLNSTAPMKALDSKYEDNCCGAAQYGGATAGSFVSMGGNQFWDGPLYSAGQPVLTGNISLTTGDAIVKNGATSAKCWGGNGQLRVISGSEQVTCNEPTGFQTASTVDLIQLNGFCYTGTGTGINVLNTGVAIVAQSSCLKSISAGTNNPRIFDFGANDNPTISGTVSVFGSATITGTSQVAGNIALTSGWSTSTVGTVSGASQRMQWTVTVAGTPAANPVITVTFPNAFFQAPLCQYQQEGGTFGVVTNPTITETATTATLTFAGTPVAAQTYVMNLACSNP